jgi:mono/diheme cytochrome c family protein
MKKLFQLLVIIGLGLMMGSCYYNTYPIEDPTAPPSTTPVSFATDIQPIFSADCVSCHGGSTAPDLRPASAYDAIVNGTYIIPNDIANSVLYQDLLGNGNLMPPSSALSTAKKNLVKNWILQGALNN